MFISHYSLVYISKTKVKVFGRMPLRHVLYLLVAMCEYFARPPTPVLFLRMCETRRVWNPGALILHVQKLYFAYQLKNRFLDRRNILTSKYLLTYIFYILLLHYFKYTIDQYVQHNTMLDAA